jgi:hypothetical protein
MAPGAASCAPCLVRCRFMVPEARRLARILFGQRKIADKTLVFRRLPELAGFCADFLRPVRRYHVFEMRDPGRFFIDLRQMLGKAAQAVLRR